MSSSLLLVYSGFQGSFVSNGSAGWKLYSATQFPQHIDFSQAVGFFKSELLLIFLIRVQMKVHGHKYIPR